MEYPLIWSNSTVSALTQGALWQVWLKLAKRIRKYKNTLVNNNCSYYLLEQNGFDNIWKKNKPFDPSAQVNYMWPKGLLWFLIHFTLWLVQPIFPSQGFLIRTPTVGNRVGRKRLVREDEFNHLYLYHISPLI